MSTKLNIAIVGAHVDDHWFGKGFVSADPTSPTTLFYLRASC